MGTELQFLRISCLIDSKWCSCALYSKNNLVGQILQITRSSKLSELALLYFFLYCSNIIVIYGRLSLENWSLKLFPSFLYLTFSYYTLVRVFYSVGQD